MPEHGGSGTEGGGTETRLCQRTEGRVQRVAELRPDCARERRVGYRGWRNSDIIQRRRTVAVLL